MNRNAWEINVVQVSDVEAVVSVRYLRRTDEPTILRGTLRGPYCEHAHTLPAEFPFRDMKSGEATAQSIVTDPCFWSEDLPHLYRAYVEALRGEQLVDEYHGMVGLRRTSPAKNWDEIK